MFQDAFHLRFHDSKNRRAHRCGKTSLCKTYTSPSEDIKVMPTVGSDFYSRILDTGNGNRLQVSFWDLSGNPDYVEVRNEFYKESNLIFLTFDLTSKKSFDKLDMWLREVSKYGGENLPVVVVGTKSDLVHRRNIT